MLLLESKNISDAEMGEWLRRNGLHSEHPGLWEQELRTLVDQKGGDKSREMKEIRKELKKRDKELNRKDKALAEMSTIIALQGCRGRVPHRSVKKQIVSDIKEAVALGLPIYKCCDALGIQTRTYYRWTKGTDDKRSGEARAKYPQNGEKGGIRIQEYFFTSENRNNYPFSILHSKLFLNGERGNVSSPVYPANCTEIARYANGRKYAYYYI